MLALALRVSASPCSLVLVLLEAGVLFSDGDRFHRGTLVGLRDGLLLTLAGFGGFSMETALGSCSGLLGS